MAPRTRKPPLCNINFRSGSLTLLHCLRIEVRPWLQECFKNGI